MLFEFELTQFRTSVVSYFYTSTLTFIKTQDGQKQPFTEVLQEAAVYRGSSRQVFLKISQYLQENTCVGASF